MPTAQLREGLDLLPQQRDLAVHHVTGHRDEIGVEGVDPLGDVAGEATVEDRTDVDVRDLGDPEAVECGRPARRRSSTFASRGGARPLRVATATTRRVPAPTSRRASAREVGARLDAVRAGSVQDAGAEELAQPEQQVRGEQSPEEVEEETHPDRCGPCDPQRQATRQGALADGLEDQAHGARHHQGHAPGPPRRPTRPGRSRAGAQCTSGRRRGCRRRARGWGSRAGCGSRRTPESRARDPESGAWSASAQGRAQAAFRSGSKRALSVAFMKASSRGSSRPWRPGRARRPWTACPVLLAGLDDRVEHLVVGLADHVREALRCLSRISVDRDAALAVRGAHAGAARRCPASDSESESRIMFCSVGREGIDDAVDRLGGVVRVQGAEDQHAHLGRGDREVRSCPARASRPRGSRRRPGGSRTRSAFSKDRVCRPDLAMREGRALVLVHELDRVLDRDDVLIVGSC